MFLELWIIGSLKLAQIKNIYVFRPGGLRNGLSDWSAVFGNILNNSWVYMKIVYNI